MALSGELQAYCDIEVRMVKSMFGTIVQGYLKKGFYVSEYRLRKVPMIGR